MGTGFGTDWPAVTNAALRSLLTATTAFRTGP